MCTIHRIAAVVAILTLPSVAVAQDASPDHRDAARELLQVTRMEEFMSGSTDAMLEMQVESNPQLAQFEDVMREFFQKHLSWQNLEPEFVNLYVKHFTAEELRELAGFYRTGLGQKAISLQGILFSEGSSIGQRIVQEDILELQQMIMQRAQELEMEGVPKP